MEVDQSAIPPRPIVAGAAIIGPTVKGKINVPTKVTSYPQYKQIFGDIFTTPAGTIQEFLTSIAARNYFEQGGDSLLVTRVANSQAFGPAKSTAIVASGSSQPAPFELVTMSPGALMNNATGSAWDEAYERGTDKSLVSGSSDNIRWEINNINESRGTFNLVIRRGDDTDKEQIVLESFGNLSLDPMSPNFISKIIGDQNEYCEPGVDGEAATIQFTGNYLNKSKYVRVANVSPVLNYLDNDGNINVINNVSASNFLPKAQYGGFWSGSGIVGACYTAAGTVDSSGSAYYYGDMQISTDPKVYNQSVKNTDYEDALSLMRNTDEYQINIISAPGYFEAAELAAVAEDRTDAIAVVDMNGLDTDVINVAANASAVNSSYGATYWPWVQMVSVTGRYEWCPASTVIPGVYTYTDHQAAPWYAPAGMTRGGVQGVLQTSRKLTKTDRDILYNKNVNPIATMPGAGIVVYGQKTLQKKASALDRVNVRRLLIEVKDTVKKMASSLLFEQNTTALQNEFKAQVDPYLASVVQRKGLVAYKIDLSENTPDVIDRNEFRCSIVLAPTKSIEFIYLTFTVSATGVSFD